MTLRIEPATTSPLSATAIKTDVPSRVASARVQADLGRGGSRTQAVPFQTMGAAPTSVARLAHGAPWLCVPGSRRVCPFGVGGLSGSACLGQALRDEMARLPTT